MKNTRLLGIALVLPVLLAASPGTVAGERSFAQAKAALHKGLRSSDASERANAVYELDGFDTPAAARTLVRGVLSRDDRARVIASAIQLLGALRAPESLEALAGEASGGGWRRRARVLEALGKTRSEVAVKVLIKAGYDEDPRVRTSALMALENIEDGRGDLVLIDALEALEWPVRSAAITALRRRGKMGAVPALIKRLEPGVETGRLRGDIATALSRITNEHFGTAHGTWEKWYENLKGSGGAGGPAPPVKGSVAPTASMAGVQTYARRIVLVLAVHQSMLDETMKRGAAAAPPDVRAKGGEALKPWLAAKTKIELARLWIDWAVNHFSPEVEFTIITYGVSANAAFSDFVRATPGNRAKASNRVTSLSASGNATLYVGLEKVFKFVSKDPVDMKSMLEGPEVVFFVSDGSSDYGEIKDAYRAFEEAERWNRYRQIQFHCIGVGQSDTRVLVDLAGMGPGGRCVSVP